MSQVEMSNGKGVGGRPGGNAQFRVRAFQCVMHGFL